MNIKDFVGGYTNHPILFVGTGVSLRYLSTSFTWDGLLRYICNELYGDAEKYLDFKAAHESGGEFYYPGIALDIERVFNAALAADRNGKFKEINDEFYRLMNKGVNSSRFKLYISRLLMECVEKPGMQDELIELKKARKNIGSIITTNYDNFIEGLFEFDPLIGNDILLSNPYGSVYKIHGCVSDPLRIIITSKDYENFNLRYELIRAQLLSMFIHNPIIFLGYKVGDENIKHLLRTIFTYVEHNSEAAEKIRRNFLLVERDQGSASTEVVDHDIDIQGFSTIRINKIKTDDYTSLYRELGSLALPISAMDVRKVQSIVREIYAGGNVGVKITEDLDSLDNSDRILAIGSSKTIQYHYQTASETMANYFSVIEEANSHLIALIDKYKIQSSQFFPVFGFNLINKNVASAAKLKKQQIEKLSATDAAIPDRCKKEYHLISEVVADPELSVSAGNSVIYYNFRKGAISIEDLENYLKNDLDRTKTDYRKLLCAYDFRKYSV